MSPRPKGLALFFSSGAVKQCREIFLGTMSMCRQQDGGRWMSGLIMYAWMDLREAQIDIDCDGQTPRQSFQTGRTK